MSTSLYQARAGILRTMAHPVRVHVLALLESGPRSVRSLLADIDVEPANLSQQLAVLRRANIVTTYRRDGLVMYAPVTPAVNDLMAASDRIIGALLTDAHGLLSELHERDEAGR